ncbi:PAS domain S-box protein [Siccirubricoccus deserti]
MSFAAWPRDFVLCIRACAPRRRSPTGSTSRSCRASSPRAGACRRSRRFPCPWRRDRRAVAAIRLEHIAARPALRLARRAPHRDRPDPRLASADGRRLGPELGILYNDAYGEVLRARHPRALGQPFQQVWSEIWDEILPLIRRTLAGKATLADNLLLATERNGRREESWYDFSFSPLRDAAGQVIGLFCVCAETTWRVLADRARAETEAALRESENRFRSLADDAPVMIWTTDATGHCIWFNRRWIEFTGRDAQNDLGFGWLAAAHPEDHARAESTFIAANASAADFTVEYRLRHRHGDWRWVLATAAARRGPGGEFLGYIGSVIDISERHAAEVAAHALNDALEARVAERTEERDRLWRISRDLMVVADFDGGVRAVNPAWTAVLGWTKAELHRTNLFTLLHPDDLGPARQETARLAAGHTTRHFETRCRHKDGNWRWISWMAAAEEGLVHGVGRDVTAERRRPRRCAPPRSNCGRRRKWRRWAS